MKLQLKLLFLCLILGCLMPDTAVAQQLPPVPEGPVVQAILFYSPTCPHCHDVITYVLPPLMEQYGDQLEIAGLDTSNEMGQYLYQTAVTQFQIPDTRLGVPTLIVGNVVLVGSLEIPDQLPTLIEEGLADGGVGWPNIPGLREILPDLSPSAAPNEPSTEPADADAAAPRQETAVPTEREAPVLSLDEIEIDPAATADADAPPADPVGFALGWTVLLGLLAGLGYGLWIWVKKRPFTPRRQEQMISKQNPTGWVLGLVTLGLVVAGYLAYVETAQVTAVCGPIGECNVVQSSRYAQILGVPVAIFGVLSYLSIGMLWLWRGRLDKIVSGLTGYALLGLTLFGTLFSIYQTTLELLVIHAICAWCLSSALITLFLFLIIIRWQTQRPLPLNPGFEVGDQDAVRL